MMYKSVKCVCFLSAWISYFWSNHPFSCRCSQTHKYVGPYVQPSLGKMWGMHRSMECFFNDFTLFVLFSIICRSAQNFIVLSVWWHWSSATYTWVQFHRQNITILCNDLEGSWIIYVLKTFSSDFESFFGDYLNITLLSAHRNNAALELYQFYRKVLNTLFNPLKQRANV